LRLFISIIAASSGVVLFYHWCRLFRKRNEAISLTEKQIAELVHKVRKAAFVAFAFQLLLVFSYSSFGAASIVCVFAVIIQSQIQMGLEKYLRGVKASYLSSLVLDLRAIAAILFLFFLYFIVTHFSFNGIRAFESTLNPGWFSFLFSKIVTFTVIIFALLVIAAASPVFVRIMFPSNRITESELILILTECFKKAGLKIPIFHSLETDKHKNFNALICGFSWMPGPFKQTLFFNRALAELLSSTEFEAIMLHEVSHIKLQHITKRAFFAAISVMVLVVPLLGALFFASTFYPQHIPPIVMGVVMFSIFLQIFLLRRQVRYHEMQADHYAVTELGAEKEAMASALIRLTNLNGSLVDRKDPNSLYNAAAAHPSVEERIKIIENPVLPRWAIISDLFSGKLRYVTVAALLLPVAAVGWGSYKILVSQDYKSGHNQISRAPAGEK